MRRPASSLLAALLAFACTAPTSPSAPPSATPTPVVSAEPSPSADTPEVAVVLAAGDIAGCDTFGDEATAQLLDGLEGTILTLGDNVYPNGSSDDFADCYDPTWGRHRDRTFAVPGNHEYWTDRATGYFEYFGDRAGSPDDGWYSFDLGRWHLIALNSNCDKISGCDEDSPQVAWLRADLDANPAACTLAFWHHPRWTSGVDHGSDPQVDVFWRTVVDAGVDVVLGGHEHNYERLVPMDASGNPAPNGTAAFVVGTGGRPTWGFADALPSSAVRDDSALGVLRLTLRPGAYDWEFVAASETDFSDAGSADCN